MKRLMLKGWCR